MGAVAPGPMPWLAPQRNRDDCRRNAALPDRLA